MFCCAHDHTIMHAIDISCSANIAPYNGWSHWEVSVKYYLFCSLYSMWCAWQACYYSMWWAWQACSHSSPELFRDLTISAKAVPRVLTWYLTSCFSQRLFTSGAILYKL